MPIYRTSGLGVIAGTYKKVHFTDSTGNLAELTFMDSTKRWEFNQLQ